MAVRIRIGTRGSALALWQSNDIKKQLETLYPDCTIDLVHIKTKGDKILDSPLSKIGDKGLFTKELETALLERHIDIAVHSLKDVTTILPDGLTLGAITSREDIRDVFISHPRKKYTTIRDLPEGAAVATGSLRRRCQLLSYRPDLSIIDIRGNIHTRLQKLDDSNWDGMVLASAGLRRLSLYERMTEMLDPGILLPAVGQGALGIEVRADDVDILELLAPLNDTDTHSAVTAERSLLRHLQGGCQVPIGAWGRVNNGTLYLDAMVGTLDGTQIVRGNIEGKPQEAESLGVRLANTMLNQGADKILESVRRTVVYE